MRQTSLHSSRRRCQAESSQPSGGWKPRGLRSPRTNARHAQKRHSSFSYRPAARTVPPIDWKELSSVRFNRLSDGELGLVRHVNELELQAVRVGKEDGVISRRILRILGWGVQHRGADLDKEPVEPINVVSRRC